MVAQSLGEVAPPSPAPAPDTTPRLAIAGREVARDRPPFVIAELSGNHNGDLDRARRLVDAAARAGADAVKLQTYTPDTITLDHDGPGFTLGEGPWAGRRLYDLYREAHTPYAWHGPLFAHARAAGLIVFSSPFDETAIDLLESLDAPAYKIASFEAADHPLIARAARTGRPLIVSTGMTTREEIAQAMATAHLHGDGGVALLHCTSAYPAPLADANVAMVARLAEDFACVTGLSDHTPGALAAVTAVALGAAIVEKHVTLARSDGGPDASFSLEPDELARLVVDCRGAFEARGEADYRRSGVEQANRQLRRSLYVVRDVPAGAPLTPADVRSIRPGFGLEPRRLGDVLRRRAARPLLRGEPLADDMLADDMLAD